MQGICPKQLNIDPEILHLCPTPIDH